VQQRSILFHAIEPDRRLPPSDPLRKKWAVFRGFARNSVPPSKDAMRLAENVWLVTLPDYPMVADRLAEVATLNAISYEFLEVAHEQQWTRGP